MLQSGASSISSSAFPLTAFNFSCSISLFSLKYEGFCEFHWHLCSAAGLKFPYGNGVVSKVSNLMLPCYSSSPLNKSKELLFNLWTTSYTRAGGKKLSKGEERGKQRRELEFYFPPGGFVQNKKNWILQKTWKTKRPNGRCCLKYQFVALLLKCKSLFWISDNVFPPFISSNKRYNP